jgi:CspA family cold shock protein
MILYITFAHYKLLLQLQCVQVTVKFFNESKGYGFITDEETGKDILFMLQESTRKNYAKVTESYEEEEGRKGKVAAKVVYLSKNFFFCLRMSKTFRFISERFFCIISKLLKKTRFNYYL